MLRMSSIPSFGSVPHEAMKRSGCSRRARWETSSVSDTPMSARSMLNWSICSSVYLMRSPRLENLGTSLNMYSTGKSKDFRLSASRKSGRMKS